MTEKCGSLQSIMCSPAGLGDDVTELALAHSNRSAALFYLQKYKVRSNSELLPVDLL